MIIGIEWHLALHIAYRATLQLSCKVTLYLLWETNHCPWILIFSLLPFIQKSVGPLRQARPLSTTFPCSRPTLARRITQKERALAWWPTSTSERATTVSSAPSSALAGFSLTLLGFSPDQFKPTNAEASFQRGDVTVYSALGPILKVRYQDPARVPNCVFSRPGRSRGKNIRKGKVCSVARAPFSESQGVSICLPGT